MTGKLRRRRQGVANRSLKEKRAMAKQTLRPLGDKVLVKRVEAEEVTAGGIVLPDSAKEKPKRGIVQSVGSGRMLDSGERSKLQVKRKDEVIFTSYAGTEIKVGGDELLILDESDILAIVD
jgi:chaperonin GroES